MSLIKPQILTKSTLRIASWISGVIIVLYILFNFFTVITLDFQLEKRLDHHLTHETEHFLNALYFEGDSMIMKNPEEFSESDLMEITENPFFLQIYSRTKKIYFRSANLINSNSIPLEIIDVPDDQYYLKNLRIDGELLRSCYTKVNDKNGRILAIIQLSTPKSTELVISKNILLFNLITFPLILFIIIFVSIFIARKSYRPINRIIAVARKISTSNLKERLKFDAEPTDEIGQLRDTLNDLFDRLDHQVNQITQFTDNASHQLMTPLTVINTELEYIKAQCAQEKCKDSMDIVVEQTQRMIQIVRSLLILAKDCKSCGNERTLFNLGNLIDSEIRKNYNCENIKYIIKKNVFLRGNKEYFSMVLQNLINNAIKYSSAGSEIRLRIETNNSQAIIYVEDQGIGFDERDSQRIFERFYRGASVESSGIEGFGLGLSLVYSIVKVMKGTVTVKENHPQGSVFIITLPLVHTG